MPTPRPSSAEVLEAIEALGVVAIIRLRDAARLRSVVDALAEGGVRAIEVTMTVPGAVDFIGDLARNLPTGCVIGAGTVIEDETARAVVDAGARFVVSPIFRRSVVNACRHLNAACMPGCFTPTEIFNAVDAGADVIKLFPATTLGPHFIKDMRALLPRLRLVPTGGVTVANAGEWIAAGAVAVGVGSALVDTALVDRGDFRALADRARRLVANVHAARGGR